MNARHAAVCCWLVLLASGGLAVVRARHDGLALLLMIVALFAAMLLAGRVADALADPRRHDDTRRR